jgi:hypothetical protein
MANEIKMLLPLRVYADHKHFPESSSFFTISFNEATKQIHVNFGNVLWVAFSSPSGLLSPVKYRAINNYLDKGRLGL